MLILLIALAGLLLALAYLGWTWWRDSHPTYPVWHDLDQPTRLRDSDEWMGI
jgi:hypothetical protein